MWEAVINALFWTGVVVLGALGWTLFLIITFSAIQFGLLRGRQHFVLRQAELFRKFLKEKDDGDQESYCEEKK